VDAEQFESQVVMDFVPSLTKLKSSGSNTLNTLNQLLTGLKTGLDLSVYGFPILTESQKNRLIRLIVALVNFLNNVQEGNSTSTLALSFTGVVVSVIDPTVLLDRATKLFSELVDHLNQICEQFFDGVRDGYKSQSSNYNISEILASLFLSGKKVKAKLDDVLQDRLMVVVQTFMTKIVSLWVASTNGVNFDEINVGTIGSLCSNAYKLVGDGVDIIDMIVSALKCVTENWSDLIYGNFESLLLGKTESSKFEATCAKIEGMYKLVKAKQSNLLQSEYGHSIESFNMLVVDTLKEGRNFVKTQTGAVLAVLKSAVTRLEIIRAEILLAIQQESLKPQPMGIILYGGSSVGKSTVQDTLAQTIIRAHGIVPSSGMINAVNYSDKFDSTTTSDSKVTLADDAGNAQSREDFSERVIDHVNTQRRPINKAAVEDKGVHFYNNIGHIISTNDHQMKNIIKSVCPESVFRRFPLHIRVKAKKEYRKVPDNEDSGFDPHKTAHLDTRERMDAYQFEVYEFVSMKSAPLEGESDDVLVDQDKAKLVELDGMVLRRVELPEGGDMPMLEKLKAFVFTKTQEHHKQAVINVDMMKKLEVCETCMTCGVSSEFCVCKKEVESQANIVEPILNWYGDTASMTRARLVSAHEEMTACLSSYNPIPYGRLLRKRVKVASHLFVHRRELLTQLKSHCFKVVCMMIWIMLASSCAATLDMWNLCFVNILMVFIVPFLYTKRVFERELRRIEREICSRPGMLTFLVPASEALRSDRAKRTFKWMTMVGGIYAVYRMFRRSYEGQDNVYIDETSNAPHTMWEFTKEKRNPPPSMCRAAHTTTGCALTDKIRENLTAVVVTSAQGKSRALALSVKGNYYVVPTHSLPTTGSYDLDFYPKGVEVMAGHSRVKDVQPEDISEMKGTDFTVVRVVASAPRWDVSQHLPLEPYTSRYGTYITQKHGEVNTEKVQSARVMRLGKGSSITTTTGAVITLAYTAELAQKTEKGMCGSVCVDETRGVILGLHAAGAGNTAVLSCITKHDVDAAMAKFGACFQPTSQTAIDIGEEQGYTLAPGDKWMSTNVENEEYNMPVEKHTWINQGIVLKDGVPMEEHPQHPFCKSDYLEEVVNQFGPTKVGPPQEMSADYHKKKAAVDYNTPKQDFSSKSVNRAVNDYVTPILENIRTMKVTNPELFDELRRELSVQEALDGINEQGLTGINNSSSIGWPYGKAKSKYMVKDELDPNIPMMPRTFDESKYPLTERLERLRTCAAKGERSNLIVKTCSKANELLPLEKKKCRPFQAMGTDALVLCRQVMAPMVRYFGRNKFQTECMLGINLKSHEAEAFMEFMTTFNEDMCIAGDFKAYDRNMSAQITSAVAEIILMILKEFDYTESQLKVANGLLTEIVYPHMNFYGQLFTLANSNPSGQPLTTHMNSIANSLYTRIIFFDLCPNEGNFRDVVKLATYGDDNAMNVADRLRGQFTHTKMSEVYANKYGMTYTMDKKDAESTPYQHFDEIGFLKQRIVYNVDYQAYVPLLDESSIQKSLHWQKKRNDCPEPPHVQFMAKVEAGLREASHYGEKYYNSYAAKMEAIKKANSTALCALKIPTYSQIVKRYFYAYHPELQEDDEEVLIFESQTSDTEQSTETDVDEQQTEPLYKRGGRKLVKGMVGVVKVAFLLGVVVGELNARQGSNSNDWSSNDRDFQTGDDDEDEDIIYESQAYTEPVATRMFAWKAGQMVGYLSSGVYVWSILPLKEIATRLPSWAKVIVGLGSETTLILNTNELLSDLPAVEAGRFDAVEYDSRNEYCESLTTMKGALELSRLHVFPNAMPGVYQAHKRVCDALARLSLTRHTLPVRESPITVLIAGGSGLGKTNIALVVAKQMLETIGCSTTARNSNIVVLNETDAFQSEYTSDVGAVIFDDVSNDRFAAEKENPLRKLLDFSNNVSKMALSPEADKKGIVAIRPKIVIVTTNAVAQWPGGIGQGNQGCNSDLNAAAWSLAEGAYMRRFDFAIQVHPAVTHMDESRNCTHAIKWSEDGPEFWKFEQMVYELTDGYKSRRVRGEEYSTMEDMLLKASEVALTHKLEQRRFVQQVLTDLDGTLCEHGLVEHYCRRCRGDEISHMVFESQALEDGEDSDVEEPYVVDGYHVTPEVLTWAEAKNALRFTKSVRIDLYHITHPGVFEEGKLPRKKTRSMASTQYMITGNPLWYVAPDWSSALIALDWFDIVVKDEIGYVASGKVYRECVKRLPSFGVNRLQMIIHPSTTFRR